MDAPDLACCTVEYIHGSQHGALSDRFAIEERLILHRAYAKADNRQLISLFSNQLAYFCALQGSSREQMIEIATQLVSCQNGTDLQLILRKRLLDLVSEDFRDCRDAFYSNKSAAFLTQLTARTIKAISESVQLWTESSNNQPLYDHIRKVLHENADRLNPHQRRQAVMDVEKWFSDSLKESVVKSPSLTSSNWDRIISFAGYQTSMRTIRCLNRSLFFACHQPAAWKHVKHVDIDLLWIPSTQEDISLLFRRTSSLLSLRCRRDPGRLTADTISAVAKFCPCLEEVWFEGWTCLTDEHVETLAKACTSLKRLTLDSCDLLTDCGLAALAKNCSQIESLSLNWCPRITLFPILSPGIFKNLRSLSVANANDRNPDMLSDAAFSRIIRLFSNLDRLVYSGRTQLDNRGLATLSISKLAYLDCSNITSVTDSWVSKVCKICPNLKFINLSKCPVARLDAAEFALSNADQVILANCNKLCNDALHNLSNCQRLSVLNLSGCASLSDPAFSKLPKDWRSVRVLCLDRCSSLTDRSISAICKRMPSIESLSLQNLRHLGNSSVSTIVSSLNRLTHLNISGCYKITDAGIGFLGSSRCSMRSLNISNLSSITDLAMQSLVSFGFLENLDVSGCSGLSYEGILILCAAAFRNTVRTLSIARCSGVESDIMKLIGICFPLLQDLDVSSCENLSDAGMKGLVSEFSNIRCISFGGCTEVTEIGVRDLLQKAPLLRFINMSCCPRISSESTQKLRQDFVGVNFVSNPLVLETSVSMKLDPPSKPFPLDRALTC